MTSEPVITVEHLPEEVVVAAGCSTAKCGKGFFALREGRINAFEKEYFRGLLIACRGDAACAAHEAQVPRGTLYRLLKKHDLDPAEFRVENSRFDI